MEAVFVQLSGCIHQVHSKETLHLCGLSPTNLGYDLTSVGDKCLSVINKKYRQINLDDGTEIDGSAVSCALTYDYETTT